MRLKGYEIINNRGRYEVYYDEILISPLKILNKTGRWVMNNVKHNIYERK